MPDKPKSCKDCDGSTTRPAPYPGPRCYTHHQKVIKERRRKAAEARQGKLYGTESGDYEEVLEKQGGRCAGCQRARGDRRKRLAKDHDHKTGLWRGLMCKRCNTILADARDDPEFFRRFIRYLEDPPAAYLQRYAPVEAA